MTPLIQEFLADPPFKNPIISLGITVTLLLLPCLSPLTPLLLLIIATTATENGVDGGKEQPPRKFRGRKGASWKRTMRKIWFKLE